MSPEAVQREWHNARLCEAASMLRSLVIAHQKMREARTQEDCDDTYQEFETALINASLWLRSRNAPASE